MGRVRLGHRERLGDVADDLDERHALAGDAALDVIAFADQLDVGQLLRLAELLTADRHGRFEVDRDEQRVLAELAVVDRVDGEVADHLVVGEVAELQVDLGDAGVHTPSAGR